MDEKQFKELLSSSLEEEYSKDIRERGFSPLGVGIVISKYVDYLCGLGKLPSFELMLICEEAAFTKGVIPGSNDQDISESRSRHLSLILGDLQIKGKR